MKEQFEWIHSWRDETAKDDSPRVLLVGDSVTHNYQEKARELLKDVCCVDGTHYLQEGYAMLAERSW